jgi:transposase
MSTQRRKFTSEFKAEAVALVRRTGQSANQIAKELGVSQTALSRWLRQSAVPCPRANGFQAAEEVQVLRREVERLRMERDILKKAAAFFANESR